MRAIIIARVRRWGFWMFGALWDTAFQVAVSPFRRAVEKGKEGAGQIRTRWRPGLHTCPGSHRRKGPAMWKSWQTGQHHGGEEFMEWHRPFKPGLEEQTFP